MVHKRIEKRVILPTMSVVYCDIHFAFDLSALVAARIYLSACLFAIGSFEHTVDLDVDFWLSADAVPKDTAKMNDIFVVARTLDDDVGLIRATDNLVAYLERAWEDKAQLAMSAERSTVATKEERADMTVGIVAVELEILWQTMHNHCVHVIVEQSAAIVVGLRQASHVVVLEQI